MSDRPINMRAVDVRALLAATKTQHRIPITSVRTAEHPESHPYTMRGADLGKALDQAADFRRLDGDIWHWTASAFSYQVGPRTNWLAHIGFAAGDRLWVRERLGRRPASFLGIEATNGVESACYSADDEDVVNEHEFNLAPWWKYRGGLSASCMPRWASRLTLIIEGVKVDRLQDISEEDALAEGCPAQTYEELSGMDPRGWYHDLWDSINGPDAWDANPWVIALTFAPHCTNIDAMEKPHAAA
ncbi:hypothetical protein [Azospirillum sp. TSA6c]|uniref:hypothetical protein n=1 Tax=Azospirillum sp. TSA6c TaxID=709813 RepID=UPI0018EE7A2F|nr:hypothetical protein [Azospirillum sp. TSA6c]